MTKLDLKKTFKEVYKAKNLNIIDYPELGYIQLSGHGAPSSDLFQDSIAALYSTAYTISMSYKGDFIIPDFENFVVSPLEGIWGLVDPKQGFDGTNKGNLKWTIMIAMPQFVNVEVVAKAKERAFDKKGFPLIEEISFKVDPPKKCCIKLHLGSYDNEPASFKEMENYTNDLNYRRISKTHREIYLTDFRKTETDKLKTILCFDVVKM